MSIGRNRHSNATGLINRSSAVLELARSSRGRKALRRQRPLSVAGFRLVSGIAAAGIEPATILDVGANAGQFAMAALLRWPQAQVTAFEPLPEIARELRERLPAGHVVHNVALGSRDASAEFFRQPYSLASSMLPPTLSSRAEHGWGDESIVLPVRRLDTFLDETELKGTVLLKLDVQGFELQVLAGATHTLRSVSALVVEACFRPDYVGQPVFRDVDDYLQSVGWKVERVLDVRRERSVPVEADCLYLRHG